MHPTFLFLCQKKKRAVHGVEEKEGFSPSCCPAPPTGAEHLSCTFHFSCGLRPKAVGAGKHCAPIVWHLSGRNLFVFAKAMHSRSKAALSAKVSRHSKFPLWRIFRMRLCSFSAAAPWVLYCFARCMGGALLPTPWAGAICTPRFFFSC